MSPNWLRLFGGGPALAVAWLVLCVIYVLAFVGWSGLHGLAPHELALVVLAVILPMGVIWAVGIVHRRAVEFARISAVLADQLDHLIFPSERGDERAQETLLALRRQAESLVTTTDGAAASGRRLASRNVASERLVLLPAGLLLNCQRYVSAPPSGSLDAAPVNVVKSWVSTARSPPALALGT